MDNICVSTLVIASWKRSFEFGLFQKVGNETLIPDMKFQIYKLNEHLPSVKVNLNSSFMWGNIILAYMRATNFCWVSFLLSLLKGGLVDA